VTRKDRAVSARGGRAPYTLIGGRLVSVVTDLYARKQKPVAAKGALTRIQTVVRVDLIPVVTRF